MTLAELKALAEKATPGPWSYSPETLQVTNSKGKLIPYETSDQVFKAAANPETVKQLIARIEGLSEAIEKTIWRADDYGDSHLSQPVREAIAQFGPDVELK